MRQNSQMQSKPSRKWSALAVIVAMMISAPLLAQSGLVEGTDYFLVQAGETFTPQVPSIVLTREAFDEVLNDLQYARERAEAAERALAASTEMLETRVSLEELLEQQKKNRWWVPVLTGAGSFLGGYLAGQSQNDTVVIR